MLFGVRDPVPNPKKSGPMEEYPLEEDPVEEDPVEEDPVEEDPKASLFAIIVFSLLISVKAEATSGSEGGPIGTASVGCVTWSAFVSRSMDTSTGASLLSFS